MITIRNVLIFLALTYWAIIAYQDAHQKPLTKAQEAEVQHYIETLPPDEGDGFQGYDLD